MIIIRNYKITKMEKYLIGFLSFLVFFLHHKFRVRLQNITLFRRKRMINYWWICNPFYLYTGLGMYCLTAKWSRKTLWRKAIPKWENNLLSLPLTPMYLHCFMHWWCANRKLCPWATTQGDYDDLFSISDTLWLR